jgi:hypothetical protein
MLFVPLVARGTVLDLQIAHLDRSEYHGSPHAWADVEDNRARVAGPGTILSDMGMAVSMGMAAFVMLASRHRDRSHPVMASAVWAL